jgi:putative transposase
MNPRLSYATDLNQAQWQILQPLIPAPLPGGRPAKYPQREIVNALLNVLRTGCSWPLLPHDFPPWKSVYGYFAKWRQNGTLKATHRLLFVLTRLLSGWHAKRSAAIMDSQSVMTTEKGRLAATTGKKVTERKRYLLVDTQGLLIQVGVHPADVQDRGAVADPPCFGTDMDSSRRAARWYFQLQSAAWAARR